MPEPSAQFPFDDDTVRPQLAADLSALYGRTPQVPKRVDEAIEATARRHAVRLRRMRVFLRWGTGVAAAAAVLLLTIGLWPSRPPVFRPGAQVTILDAFSLARQIKSGKTIDKSWDINNDGIID